MKILATELGFQNINEMFNLLMQVCLEKSNKNDGECIYNLIKELGMSAAKATGKNIPYCATTVSVALKRVFGRMNMQSPLANPVCQELVNQARRNGIRIDRTPSPGAVFIVTNDDGGLHAGMVWYVKDKRTFGTIEGNTTGYMVNIEEGCVKKANREGILFKERTTDRLKYVLHIEEFLGTEMAEYDIIIPAEISAGLSDNADGTACATFIETTDSSNEESPDTYMAQQNIYRTLGLIAGGLLRGAIWQEMNKKRR